jgi:hypothetical protein
VQESVGESAFEFRAGGRERSAAVERGCLFTEQV